MRALARIIVVSIVLFAGGVGADSTSDTQLWDVFRVDHPVGEHWAASLWTAVRFNNDISEYTSTLLRPSLHYTAAPQLRVGLGYNWSSVREDADEHRLFQEVALGQRFGRLAVGHRARLEERWIHDISTIFRARYRLQGAHPLWGSSWYGVLSEEVLVNLNGRGEGPVSGFEQNRLSAGLGVHLGSRVRVQLGYTWRLKESRSGPDAHDHILGLNVFVSTRAKQPPPHPAPEEMHH